jgi:hypothetical protein
MLLPSVLPWMIKQHPSPTDGISGINFGVFVIIAALAGECQILQGCGTAFRPWHDMFDRKCLCREPGLTPAIFTMPLRTGNNGLPLLSGNPFFRHRQVIEYLACA